jgi:hypothetical protein
MRTFSKVKIRLGDIDVGGTADCVHGLCSADSSVAMFGEQIIKTSGSVGQFKCGILPLLKEIGEVGSGNKLQYSHLF